MNFCRTSWKQDVQFLNKMNIPKIFYVIHNEFQQSLRYYFFKIFNIKENGYILIKNKVGWRAFILINLLFFSF